MEGYTHALSGAAAWLALTSSSAVAIGVSEQASPVVLGGAVVCAGAALLPDLDHHNGTIAHSLRPLSKWMTRAVARLSGGHRHGTHSLIGVAVFALIAYLASIPTMEIHGKTVAVGSGIVAALCIAFASKSLGLTKGLGFRGVAGDIMSSPLGEWIVAFGVAGVITWLLDYQWTWLGPCIALGAFIHIVGDMLTPEGVPWLWPWNPKPPAWWPHGLRWFWHRNGYFRFPILGTVSLGSSRSFNVFSREAWFGLVLSLYVIYVCVFNIAQMNGSTLPYVI